MNCKPGDIAIAIRGKRAGALVEVLYWVGHFSVADGDTCEDGWMLRSLCSFRFEYGYPGQTKTYKDTGVGRDAYLRPLRGLPETEKHDEEIAA